MKQFILCSIVVALSLFFSISCSQKEQEQEIAISELPAIITTAIQDTLPGFEIAEAEIETKDKKITYEVEGIYQDQQYEIEISPDGKIIEIEEEDSDSDDENEEADENDDEEEADEHGK